MVLDAAKGIESQTRKLFEVCRLRDIPIVTFVNKMDREARDPFELIEEIQQTLALDAAPVAWPVGRASDLLGHLRHPGQAPDAGGRDRGSGIAVDGPDDPRIAPWSARSARRSCRRTSCSPRRPARFDLEAFREGTLTPGLLRLRAARLRRRPPAGGPARIAPPPGRGRRPAPGASRRSRADRLRLQGAGQHGPRTTATASPSCGCAAAG
jgi:peptide chain release factor 3